ncbi:MAG: GspE/PulE family protein, partial [Patescibacteria group bacterium]
MEANLTQQSGQAAAVQADEKLKQLQDSILAANIPQLVLVTISYALDLRSSDIHIEPLKTHIRIRYRVDGVLREVVEYPS